jgi:hypothetical protein
MIQLDNPGSPFLTTPRTVNGKESSGKLHKRFNRNLQFTKCFIKKETFQTIQK